MMSAGFDHSALFSHGGPLMPNQLSATLMSPNLGLRIHSQSIALATPETTDGR